MSIVLILILIALATVPAIIFKKKLGIEVKGPLCMWRTERTLGIIEKLSKRKKLWRSLADLGIVFAFGLLSAVFLILDRKEDLKKIVLYYAVFVVSILLVVILPPSGINSTLSGTVTLLTGFGGFALLALLQQSLTIITKLGAGQAATPGVAPVIPGMSVPGLGTVPLYALIGLVILLIVHEWGHGIVSRAEGIAVKSVGLVTLGIFPLGAFTEPDEEELEETTRRKRTRVYSIGSMMNLVTAFAFSVFLLIPMAVFVSPGLQQQSIDNIEYFEVTSVAETSNFKGKIDVGTRIYNVEDIYNTQANQKITLETDQGEITGTTNQFGRIGIGIREETKGILGPWYWIQNYAIGIVTWIVLLNFLVGVINYLPFAIFDGARIAEDMVGFYAEKLHLNSESIGSVVSWSLTVFVSILLIINVLPYFF